MRVISKTEFLEDKEEYISRIKKGAVFIYPTDTIYGIGCSALDDDAVERVRKLKARDSKPFSVIAPSKDWIIENCTINFPKELDNLPGPYTFVLKASKGSVSLKVNPNLDMLGVRIPDNWFSGFVSEIDIPIVTTSVNKSGAPFMTCLEDSDNEILHGVDFIIYEGKKTGKPSTLITMTGDTLEIKERVR